METKDALLIVRAIILLEEAQNLVSYGMYRLSQYDQTITQMQEWKERATRVLDEIKQVDKENKQ